MDKAHINHLELTPSTNRGQAALPKLPQKVASETCPIYEQLLNDNPSWALSEGSRHFEENSAVFQTLRNITARLHELGIAYAVIGAMAMFYHGYRRFTEDVNLLVTRSGLRTIHEKLCGDGFWSPSPHT